MKRSHKRPECDDLALPNASHPHKKVPQDRQTTNPLPVNCLGAILCTVQEVWGERNRHSVVRVPHAAVATLA